MHSHDGYRKILDQEKHDDVSFTTVFTTEDAEDTEDIVKVASSLMLLTPIV